VPQIIGEDPETISFVCLRRPKLQAKAEIRMKLGFRLHEKPEVHGAL